MGSKLSKQAALDAGDIYDKAAQLTLTIAKAAGINPEIAQKFAFQCDLLADHIAKSAGVDIAKLAADRKVADEDPAQIGVEKSGPKEQEGDESYMSNEFTQQENRELREKVQSGELNNSTVSPEQQSPKPGVQAALENGKKLAALYMDINSAATRCASADDAGIKGLGDKLAAAGLDVLQFQTRLLEGSESTERLGALTRAAAHVMPHLVGVVPAAAAEKLARMIEIFAGLAKSV